MIVPNFDLVNNRIINLSDPSRASTCTTQIRVPYSADFERVSTICTKILVWNPSGRPFQGSVGEPRQPCRRLTADRHRLLASRNG